MVFALYVITSKLPGLSGCYKRNIVKSVNSSEINVMVTCTANCTCHQVTNSRYEIKIFKQSNIYTWLYVLVAN